MIGDNLEKVSSNLAPKMKSIHQVWLSLLSTKTQNLIAENTNIRSGVRESFNNARIDCIIEPFLLQIC